LGFAVCLASAGITVDAPGKYDRDVVGNGDLPEGGVSNYPSSLLDPNGNTVHFSGETTDIFNVYGSKAYTTSGTLTASGNALNISGPGSITMKAFGAYAEVSGTGIAITLSGNLLTIDDGKVSRNAAAGYIAAAGSGIASGNEATINGGSISDAVLGGFTLGFFKAEATGNRLNFNGGTAGKGIGGSAKSTSEATEAVAMGNRAVFIGGTLKDYIAGGMAENFNLGGTASARGNQATITGGIFNEAFGGYVLTPGTSLAVGNVLDFSGGQAASLSGAMAVVATYPMSTGMIIGMTTGNAVTVSGGLVTGNVYGGHSGYFLYFNPAALTLQATGNAVLILDGEIQGNVYGGYVNDNSGLSTTAAAATGNSVTVSGTPNLTMAGLYGGYSQIPSGDAKSGNALNVMTSGLSVKEIRNFEFLNFFLPAGLAGGATVVTVSGTAEVAGTTVSVDGLASRLGVGDEVILIDAGGGVTGPPDNSQATGRGMQGVSVRYAFDLVTDANRLMAVVTVAELNEGVKALAEGFAAGLGLVIAGDGGPGEAAVKAVGTGGVVPGAPAWRVFSAVAGGRERLNTGSHVDISGVSVSLGVARRFYPGSVGLVAGAFVEYGAGTYDTYNGFPGMGAIRGEGEVGYVGGGALLRVDNLAAGPGAFHVELSGRAGSVKNDYGSRDLRSTGGTAASYGISTTYFGIGLGAGYGLSLSDSTAAEIYARWAFTRQKGATARLSTGERVTFEDADSSRLKVGARVRHSFGGGVEIYAGAGWEREFLGAARSSIHGLSVDPPSMRGDTGFGELGVSLRPAGGPVTLDLGVQGYFGKREGVSGSLVVRLEF
jgi:hypothetical protein